MNLVSDICFYSLISFGAYKAYTAEKLDMYCPPEVKKYCKSLCGDNKGKYYIRGQPKNTDDVNELLNKIKISANCESSTVKWRKCLLMSIIICILISLIVIKRFPHGYEF